MLRKLKFEKVAERRRNGVEMNKMWKKSVNFGQVNVARLIEQ